MLHALWVPLVVLLGVFALQAVAQTDEQSFVGIGMAFDRSPDKWVRVGACDMHSPAPIVSLGKKRSPSRWHTTTRT